MVKKKVKEVSDQNTEEKILAAAKKVLFSKGYAGARMQDIADEAGINKALLHYYFRSKDKLFEMIFKEAIGKLMPQISTIFSDINISFYDKIRAFCHSYISTWLEHPYIPMFVLHELHSDSGKGFLKMVEETRFKPVRDALSAIETAITKKEIRRVDPHHLFLHMISLCMFPFMGSPVFKKVTGITDKQFDIMMQQRAVEVSEFIIESIKYRK
jgi:TetR/AcrR family transcriptional regulator